MTAGHRVGSLSIRSLASAFGLRYLDPFRYDAGSLELRPTVSYPAGPFIVSAAPRLSLGAWSTADAEGDLRVVGGTVEARRAFGALSAALTAGAWSVENGVTAGTFARAGGTLSLNRDGWTAALQIGTQRTPREREVGGGVQLSLVMAPGVEVTAYAGRRLRDPLLGTTGSLGVSLSAAVRAFRWSAPGPPPVVSMGDAEDGGRVVRFAIRAPEAETVAVTGDFTGWDPRAMDEGEREWWYVSLVLPPGLHHFGFLVDGEWAIPPEAPGVVEDGWGRRNASIVVEP